MNDITTQKQEKNTQKNGKIKQKKQKNLLQKKYKFLTKIFKTSIHMIEQLYNYNVRKRRNDE